MPEVQQKDTYTYRPSGSPLYGNVNDWIRNQSHHQVGARFHVEDGRFRKGLIFTGVGLTPGDLEPGESAMSIGNLTGVSDVPAGGGYDLPMASAAVLGGVKVGTGLTISAAGVLSVTALGGVTSFNNRTGAISLTSTDVTNALTFTPISGITSSMVTTALGYTPFNLATQGNTFIKNQATLQAAAKFHVESGKVQKGLIFTGTALTVGDLAAGEGALAMGNLSGVSDVPASSNYELPQASASVLGGIKVGTGLTISATGVLSVSALGGVTSFQNRTGAVTLTSADITNTLGYTPISGITSSMVTTALGFTPYNATNPAGYISGITSSMVTTALGYTPFDATANGNTFIKNQSSYQTNSTFHVQTARVQKGVIFTGTGLTAAELGTGEGALAIGNLTGVSDVPAGGGGDGAAWGSITGTLSSQTDLQNALSAKLGISATAANATKWGNQTYTGTLFTGTIQYLMSYDGTANVWKPTDQATVRTFLGLGTAAYQGFSDNNVASSLVRRDSSGYGYFTAINCTGISAGSVTEFIVKNGADNYYREASVATVQTALGLKSAAYRDADTFMYAGPDIGAGADLDTYTTNGFYHQNSTANAQGGTHYPTAIAGMLEVMADGAMIYQRYTVYSTGDIWSRVSYLGTWNAWRKAWNTIDFAINNYALLSGAAFTGAISGTSATFSSSLQIKGNWGASVPTGKGVEIEYNAGDYGRIIAFDRGTSTWKNLVLNSGGGNVGIRITSPTAILHAAQAGTSEYFLKFGDTTAQVNRFTVDGTGALTGTSATFKGTAAYNGVFVDNTGATGGGYLAVRQNGITSGIFGVAGSIEGNAARNMGIFAESGLGINLYTGGSASIKAHITPDGRFGIGNGSPASLFEVNNGTTNVQATVTTPIGLNSYSQLVLGHGSTYFGASDVRWQIQSIGKGATVGNGADFKIQYWNGTAYTEYMRITSSGLFGIGTTVPYHKLDVNLLHAQGVQFASNIGLNEWNHVTLGYTERNGLYEKVKLITQRLDSAARADFHICVNTVSGSASASLSDSRLKISGTTGSVYFSSNAYVAGTITATGDVVAYSTSDPRFKDHLTPLVDPLAILSQLDGYRFVWNNGQKIYTPGTVDYGFNALEVRKVLPEIVTTREDGTLAMHYDRIIPINTAAINQLHKRIQVLEQQVKALERRN